MPPHGIVGCGAAVGDCPSAIAGTTSRTTVSPRPSARGVTLRLCVQRRRRVNGRARGGSEVLHSGAMAAQARSEPGDGSRGLRPVILVVDDEPGLREAFHLILDDDYEVVDVPDGAAALDVVRCSQVDLVLLVIRLRGMDGI